MNNTELTSQTDAPSDGITPDYSFVNTIGRIAIYDDLRSAPRVMEIQPAETAAYIDNLAMTVYQQAQAAGGTIPHMVIREVSENFIHAQFKEIVVSILDRGKTIRFADHGPGIPSKEQVQQPGFTSASDPMRNYIRGVGSGLPIVREYLAVSDGTITIEDNLGTGAVVTVSLVREEDDPLDDWTEQPLNSANAANAAMATMQAAAAAQPVAAPQMPAAQAPAPYPAYAPNPYGAQPAGYPAAMPAAAPYPQPAYAPQPTYPPYGTPQPAYAAPYPAPYPAQPNGYGYPAGAVVPAPYLNDLQRELLSLLAHEGPLSNKELSDLTERPANTVSTNVSALAEMGLVDKASRMRALTPYGQQVAQTL